MPIRDEEDDLISYGNPALRFQGAGPVFLGMELEITVPHSRTLRAARAVLKACDNLVWLKYDGSVDGFEIVSHPMDYPFWQQNFPWAPLMEVLVKNDCSAISRSNGIHVHVNRDGFTGPAHTYSWLKLLYRNQQQVINLAGRHCSWGSFKPDQRAAQLVHLKNAAKRAKAGYGASPCQYGYDYPRRAGIRSWEQDAEAPAQARYCAVNLTNDKTLEVRVFASTTDADVAQSRLQLVAASVEYTRGLRAQEVVSGAWTWPAFTAWVNESGQYPQLAAQLAGMPAVRQVRRTVTR